MWCAWEVLGLMWKLHLLCLEGLLWKADSWEGAEWLRGFPGIPPELPLNFPVFCCSWDAQPQWERGGLQGGKRNPQRAGLLLSGSHSISPSSNPPLHSPARAELCQPRVPVHAWFHPISPSSVPVMAARLTTKNQSCISSREVCFLLGLINQ